MSGDVQPRKRKDKKKKKDDLGVEEPRGTAAALGEGDVFLHSHHEHGTGGHWCAKIIFFSLLAVLITLIGLIILENRGLSELEANSVESRYSGVLEGWLEDAPDDDHHDEHTLELNHHGDENDHNIQDDEHDDEDHNFEDDHDDEDDHELEDEEENSDQDDIDDEDLEDEEGNSNEEEQDNEDDENGGESNEYLEEENQNNDEEDDRQDSNDEDQLENDEDFNREDNEDEEENLSNENEDNDHEEHKTALNNEDDDSNYGSFEDFDGDENEENGADNSNEDNKEDDDDHDEEHEEEAEEEIEKIEQEASDEEPISTELPALPEAEDDDEDDHDEGPASKEDEIDQDDDDDDDADDDDDDDFLDNDDDGDEPAVERITAPSGKPFDEVEEEVSSERPPNSLAEEEEYEKRQEQLRKEEEEQSSDMWLKLSVGGALLAATHAVLRRTRTDETTEDHDSREETPSAGDRRMTIIPDIPEEPEPVAPKKVVKEPPKPIFEIPKRVTKPQSIIKPPKEDSEEEEEIKPTKAFQSKTVTILSPKDKEIYSDEEDEPEEIKKPTEPEPESEEEVADDVEIIDEEIEEELEEEEDDISDVDDAELLTRLEAKYGRLPEPERPGMRKKDGGNSLNDLWPGEPSDSYWRQQLDDAERQLREGAYIPAYTAAAAPALQQSARARYILAQALDKEAEQKRDNKILSRAIAAYLQVLKMNEGLTDKQLLEVANKTLDRIQFRGTYLSAEPVYRLLIRRFPDDPGYRNNLTVSFLMANRADLAEEVLKETLRRWKDDRFALAHYGFVLKNQHNRYEEAVKLFERALEGDTGPACEPRFYYHLGDALLLLGRPAEAHEVHVRAAKLGHFLSPAQRSLYNVKRLKSKPWWDVNETPYAKLAKTLESSWKEILKEGLAAEALFEEEKEGLKLKGEWSQLDIYARGREIPGRCARAPATCAVVRGEAGARCARGQVKFSSMRARTHVRAHVGPTNCRLRMHLALSNTEDTFIRVDQEIRQWQVGKVLMFDDSFEHEVWHNGTRPRLVLIVDVWHPDLTEHERRTLPPI